MTTAWKRNILQDEYRFMASIEHNGDQHQPPLQGGIPATGESLSVPMPIQVSGALPFGIRRPEYEGVDLGPGSEMRKRIEASQDAFLEALRRQAGQTPTEEKPESH